MWAVVRTGEGRGRSARRDGGLLQGDLDTAAPDPLDPHLVEAHGRVKFEAGLIIGLCVNLGGHTGGAGGPGVVKDLLIEQAAQAEPPAITTRSM